MLDNGKRGILTDTSTDPIFKTTFSSAKRRELTESKRSRLQELGRMRTYNMKTPYYFSLESANPNG